MVACGPACGRSSAGSGVVVYGALVMLLLLLASAAVHVDAQLTTNYYAQSCPSAESIVKAIVRSRVIADRSVAASLLRLHFHDCFVIGCEGSVLLDSTRGNLAEKDAPPNANSLRGFDIIDTIKSTIERSCPGVVSVADILALAARDAIASIGGPSWRVPTGRRDGTASFAAQASAALPDPSSSYTTLVKAFAAVGLSESEMVTLSAAHTIGLTRCSMISKRLYNFPGSKDGIDPSLNKAYALDLRKSCPPGSGNRVPMDPTSGGQTFDNSYYKNLFNNMGLFPSDKTLISNNGARGRVVSELNSQAKFFADFGLAMEKMGRIGVLTTATSYKGEIRLNPHRPNSVTHASKAANIRKPTPKRHKPKN